MASSAHEKTRIRTAALALCGLLTALGTGLMLLGGYIPGLTYCAPLLAGLLLTLARVECSPGWSWGVWLVTSLLLILLGGEMEATFFYVFLGIYPVVKPRLDQIPNRALRFAAKLLLLCALVCMLYGFLLFVLRPESVLESFRQVGIWVNIAFLAGLVACMLLYDALLRSLTVTYLRRLRPKLKRGR